MLQIGDEYSLSIADVALPSGYGVTRHEGMVIFIPGALPGDRVRTRIAKLEKHFAYGDLLGLDETSPFRQQEVTEICARYGQCGGCELQALAYEKQLEIKQNHLEQVLLRIGGLDLSSVALAPIAPSVDCYYYRSKIEFTFGNGGTKTIVGLSERMLPLCSHAGGIVPVDSCRLFSPVAERILPLVREALAMVPKTGGGTTNPVALKRLILREGKRTGEVMVNLVAETAPDADFIRRLATLADSVPEVKSICLTVGGRMKLLHGSSFIHERFGGLTLRVYPFSFFQPNPKTAEELCRCIIPLAQLGGTERILGFYCGAGTIELFLASHAKEVIGIDSSGESIACAAENKQINKIDNVVFRKIKAEHTFGPYRRSRPDVAIIDPPRAGLSREALAVVKKTNAPRLLYISCNPSTLARDLKLLLPQYRPEQIVPFDFFPHTGHFEVLTLLTVQ